MKNQPDGEAELPDDGRQRRRNWRRRLLLAATLAAIAVSAAAWGMQRHVFASGRVFCAELDAAPRAECILVPGARIHADGQPYSMLADRLALALELYRRGKAPRIVVSGRGDGGIADNEVAAMRAWLQQRGVPAAAIVDDPGGLRTILTMRCARDVHGVGSALIATNEFHLPRAVFLARRCGLRAHGVPAPPRVRYSRATMWRNRARETLGRVRAWLDVYLLGRCD